jgi:hypothetical protein
MNITEMNRANAKLVREILNDKLPSILNEYGLSFELGNAKFDEDGVRFTGFRLSVKGALSETEKALREELEFRNSYGIELDQNKTANFDGMDVSLVGFRPKAKKYPFVIQNLNSDKQYAIKEALAEKLFKKDEGGQS